MVVNQDQDSIDSRVSVTPRQSHLASESDIALGLVFGMFALMGGKLRPDGGDQTAYKPPCYAPKTKNRLELRVKLGGLSSHTTKVRS